MSSTTKQTMSVVVDNAEKLAIITLARGIGYGYGVENWNEDIMTAKNAGAEKIILKINSPGGDVITGLALYDEIKNSPLPVTAQVFGEASSAATLVALGASRVEMSANSLWMVHEMRGGIYGTEDEIRSILDKDFHANVEKVITIYAEKTGMSREAVLAAQKEELYLNAREAMEKGWVDAVIGAAPAAQEEKPEESEEKEPEQKPGMVRGTMEHLRKLGYLMLGKDTPEAREMKATLDRLAAEQKAAQESAEAARAELARLQEQMPEMIDKAVASRIADMGMSAAAAPAVEVAPAAAVMTDDDLRTALARGGVSAMTDAMLGISPR